MTTGKTIALTRWTFLGKIMSLLFNKLFRLVIPFLPRSRHLLISWLQSPSVSLAYISLLPVYMFLRVPVSGCPLCAVDILSVPLIFLAYFVGPCGQLLLMLMAFCVSF